MSYWLHSAEFKGGAHHSASLAPLKIGRFKIPVSISVKVGEKKNITKPTGEVFDLQRIVHRDTFL
jgi:hypothetical protein